MRILLSMISEDKNKKVSLALTFFVMRIFFVALALIFVSCASETESSESSDPGNDPVVYDSDSYTTITGQTMGTNYSITLKSSPEIQKSVDSMLEVINNAVSTYIPTSTISQFNQADSGFKVSLAQSPHFIWNCMGALDIESFSQGYFNPRVMPLVNYYGFGYEPGTKLIDSAVVDSLAAMTVDIAYFLTQDKNNNTPLVIKANEHSQIDFSAMAKGYAVDLIGAMLQQRGILHYLIDIGGETITHGVNDQGKAWMIGITKPKEDNGEESVPYLRIQPGDLAMATSGNYENYKIIDGIKVVHTIDPYTGYPKSSRLLSVTVVEHSCMVADGLATGMMASGLENAIAFIEKNQFMNAVLIYSDENGELQWFASDPAKDLLVY